MQPLIIPLWPVWRALLAVKLVIDFPENPTYREKRQGIEREKN